MRKIRAVNIGSGLFRLDRKLDMPQLVLLAAGVTYVLGIVIQNITFASLGIPSTELARLRYLTTGLLFVAFLGIIVVPSYFWWRICFSGTQMSISTKVARGLVVSLLTFGAAFLLEVVLILTVELHSVAVAEAIDIAIKPEAGWALFLGLAFVLHIVTVIIIAFPPARKNVTVVGLVLSPIALLLYISLIPSLMAPQFGGISGQPVVPITSNKLLTDCDFHVYLLDRTPTDFIFYRRKKADRAPAGYFIIPTSEIKGIRLPPSPTECP